MNCLNQIELKALLRLEVYQKMLSKLKNNTKDEGGIIDQGWWFSTTKQVCLTDAK